MVVVESVGIVESDDFLVVEVYVVEDVLEVVLGLSGIGKMVIRSVGSDVMVLVVGMVGDGGVYYFLDGVNIGKNLKIGVGDLGEFGC